MLWFAFGLATALTVALQDSLAKRFFGHRSSGLMNGFLYAYSLPWLGLGWFFTARPPLAPEFYWASGFLLPLNGLAMWIYMLAVKRSPLSLIMPVLAFSPAFLIVIGWVLLGERLTGPGIVGILAIIVGSWLLFNPPGGRSLWGPFRALWNDSGARLMLLDSLLFALNSALGKMAINASEPAYFAFAFFTVHNLVLLVIFRLLGQYLWVDLVRHWRQGWILGGLYFFHLLFHHLGVALTQTAYLIAVKRLNLVFSVVLGKVLLGETDLGRRLAAAAVMFLGVAAIYLGG